MRLVTTITSLIGIAAIAFVFAGHAFAGQTTTSTAASSSFGGSHTQKVHVHSIERWLGGGGHLKQVPCPVTGTLTVCYASR
jgi:hypothetical protein